MKITQEMWNQLLNDFSDAKINKKNLSIEKIMDKYGCSKWAASTYKFALENKDIIHNDMSQPMQHKRKDSKIKILSSQNKNILEELEQANERFDFITEISSDSKIKVKGFKNESLNSKKDKSAKRDSIAFGILSDVHIEESVTYEQTDGINEYNPEIAAERIEFFFKNFLKLVEKERTHCNIDTIVLGLLGDFITGYIHEELMETNHMSPTEATLYVKNLLIKGIMYLAENGNFKKIIIPCTPGNHGRTTRFKRFSSGYKNSYEWMMYQDIKKIFSEYVDPKYREMIEIITSKNELIYINFYNDKYSVRFGHGDHFKYAGGIGGLIVPLKKWLMRMNEQRKADMTFIGHWHTLLLGATEDCMVNSSVIGMNSYSKQFGGIPKEPTQIFTLLDKEEGFTIRTPIFLKAI